MSKAAQHLNDQVGILSLFDPHSGRWQVRLPDGSVKAFKPDNLALEGPAPGAEDEEGDGEGGADEEEDETIPMDIDVDGGADLGVAEASAADANFSEFADLDANELAAAALEAELTGDTECHASLTSAIEARKAMCETVSSGTSGMSLRMEEKVEVPVEVVGSIIGHGGTRIRDLSAEAGVRMTFARENSTELNGTELKTRTCLIRGAEDQIARAKKLLQEAIDGALAWKGKGKGKGKRGKGKGKGGKAFDRVGEGAGGQAGYEQGICKWYAAGFCRNSSYNGCCRNGLHNSDAARKAESDWVAQGPEPGSQGLPSDPTRPVLLLLDLEGGGNRDGRDGEDEIIEVPVLAMDPITGRELGRFHRFARPGFWDREAESMRRRFPRECFNVASSSVPFPLVIAAMKEFICQIVGAPGPTDLKPDSFLFVTCGNWDVKTAIPLQCNKPLPGTVDLPTQQLLFSRWSNLKDVFRDHYRLPPTTAPTGMRGMLNRLRIPLKGQHHLGMDDVSNLAKILKRLIAEECKIAPTGQANLTAAPMGGKGFAGVGKSFGKDKGKGKCGKAGGKGKAKQAMPGLVGYPVGTTFAKGGTFSNSGSGLPPKMVPPKVPPPGAIPSSGSLGGIQAPPLFGALPKAAPKRPVSSETADKEEAEDEDDYDPFAEEPAPHLSSQAAPVSAAKRRRGALGQFLRGAPLPGETWVPDGSDTEGSASGAEQGLEEEKEEEDVKVKAPAASDLYGGGAGGLAGIFDRQALPPARMRQVAADFHVDEDYEVLDAKDEDGEAEVAADATGEADTDGEDDGLDAEAELPGKAPRLAALFASLPAPRAAAG